MSKLSGKDHEFLVEIRGLIDDFYAIKISDRCNQESKIKHILSTVFDIPLDDINHESSPDTIDNWDSIKHMNLVFALEEEFGILFSDNEILEMLSLSHIIEIISKK